MFAGTALSVRLFVCVDLSLFIICGPYLSVVVCVFYAYNLTEVEIDEQELFANYVTLQIHMMDDDEFIELALGKEAVDGQPSIKANLIRARQLSSALTKANNLKQGKGISAQCT